VEPPDLAHLNVRPAVERLVTSLPPMERACVLLKDVFEYSLEEISELVGSTVGGVKSALKRGRMKLAKGCCEMARYFSALGRDEALLI
jgi:RNA polymerase sigma-70 factor, ECF subfamily